MFCPMCGAPNEEDSDFCANCGAALNPDAPAAEDVPAERHAGSEEETDWESGVRDEPKEEAPASTETTASADPAASEPEKKAVVPPPPPPPPRPAPSARPAAARPSSYRSSSVQTSGLAIASLVLGIGGVTILPLLGSILAILLGYMARREIRQRPGELEGDGIALAGIVLGWISVGLAVLGLLFFGGITVCSICGSLGAGGFQ